MKHTIIRLTTILLFLLACNAAHATTITYTDFSDLSAFQLNGVTTSINSGGTGVIGPGGQRVLRLTNNTSQAGSAFLTNAISLANDASFSTAFQFQFTDQQGGGADGIVFTIQTNSNTAGGSGGGIGYYGISNSVGIEFDNWYNAGDDPSGSHVGIDLNGSVNSVVAANVANLDDGNIRYAWVDYDGATDLLEVRLSTTDNRPAAVLLSHTVDLTTVLGQTDAFIGFTSGTGSAGADHDIRAWQFTNDFDPIDTIQPVPEPASLLLLGSGLLGLAVLRRRTR